MITREDVRAVAGCVRPHARLAAATLSALSAAALMEGVGVGLLIPILQSIEGGAGADAFSSAARKAFSCVGLPYGFTQLMGAFVALMLVKYGMEALQQYCSRLLSATVMRELRDESIHSLMAVPLAHYYTAKTGDLVATVYTSTAQAGAVMELGAQMLVSAVFAVVYVGVGMMISVPLALTAIILTTVSYGVIIPKFRLGFTQGQEEKSITDELSSFLFDTLRGIKTVKTFHNERWHEDRLRGLTGRFARLAVRIQQNRIMASLGLEPFVTLLVAGLMILSVRVLRLPAVHLLAFFYIFSRIIPRVKLLNSQYLEVMGSLPHFHKVFALIRQQDGPRISVGTRQIRAIETGVELRGVVFRYPGTAARALLDVDLRVPKGSTVGIIGASGSGKTTLVDILLRHHDPEAGAVLVDGVDLREIERGCWHRLVSMVEQDAALFNETILENIRYGKDGASESDIASAAELANAHGFVSALPEAYRTVVGERGITLSGGQRQRICLARALLRDPQLLILDEATSALDSESEGFIRDAIARLGRSKTLVIIAHRLSTIEQADMLYVLEGGRIVEKGPPGELLRSGGVYRRLREAQERGR